MTKLVFLFLSVITLLTACSNETDNYVNHYTSSEISTINQIADKYGVKVEVGADPQEKASPEEIEQICQFLAKVQNMKLELRPDSINKVCGSMRILSRKSTDDDNPFANMELETGSWSGEALSGVGAYSGVFSASITYEYEHNKHFECYNPSCKASGSFESYQIPSKWTTDVKTTECTFGNWEVSFSFKIELRSFYNKVVASSIIGGFYDVLHGIGHIG